MSGDPSARSTVYPGDEQPADGAMPGSRRLRVFVTYAHDSEQHKGQVLRLCAFLRDEVGVDVHVDEWANPPEWSIWAEKQVMNADFVLVVASPAYKRAADGGDVSKTRRGSRYEISLLREKLTEDRDTWRPKLLSVLLPERSVHEIPFFLQPHSASHYEVTNFTREGAAGLLRTLTG